MSVGAAIPPAVPTSALNIGGTVSVLAVWEGIERDGFMAMMEPFQDQAGVRIQYTGTRNLADVLERQVQSGTPPNVVASPSPGLLLRYAEAGKLTDLGTILERGELQAQYAEDWLKVGSTQGKLYGVPVKAALKSLIWQLPPEWDQRGYKVPATWDELMALSEKIAGGGTPPWSVALDSEQVAGWPGTDWIEDIVLRQAGPEFYDRWYEGKIKWSAPEIRKAWETWGQIVARPDRMVFGGKKYMLETNFAVGINPLFEEPPRAFMFHGGSFIGNFVATGNPTLKPVTDYTFFRFPAFGGDPFPRAMIASGDLFAIFNPTPQAVGMLRYVTNAGAQAVWAKRGGLLAPNKQVPDTAYPDPVSRSAAVLLHNTPTVRFDASDLMPPPMYEAFRNAVLQYVANPDSLNAILAKLDEIQASAAKPRAGQP